MTLPSLENQLKQGILVVKQVLTFLLVEDRKDTKTFAYATQVELCLLHTTHCKTIMTNQVPVVQRSHKMTKALRDTDSSSRDVNNE